MQGVTSRIAATVVLAALLGATQIGAVRGVVFENRLLTAVDRAAESQVEAALGRAAAAFLLARTFNALVSVVQGSQLQLSPAGVGVSLALGEALDPINDLVERFSWVMLASLTALGIQRVLIEIGAFISIDLLMVCALVVLIAGLWLERWVRFDLIKAGKVLLVLAVLVRLAVPAMTWLNQRIYRIALADRHDRSVRLVEENLEQLKPVLEAAAPTTPVTEAQRAAGEAGLLERARAAIGRGVEAGRELFDLKQKIEVVKTVAGQLVERITTLIVVFILDTILFPLVFLWAGMRLARLFLGGAFARRREPPLPQPSETVRSGVRKGTRR